MNNELYNKLYNDIKEFRAAFNLPINDGDYFDLNLHESLLLEEMEELALSTTRTKQLDAIVDSMYARIGKQVNAGLFEVDPIIEMLYKLTLKMNFKFEKAWGIIHASNMSKLCVSYEEAEETVKSYIELGYLDLAITNVDNNTENIGLLRL